MRPPLTLRTLASRKNSLTLGLTIAATAAFVGWLVYAYDYLGRVYNGPEPVTQTQLAELGPEAFGRWFDVTAEAKPGHLLKTTTRGRRGSTTVTNHFALIKTNTVIVETGWDVLPPKFLAWASEFSRDSDYYKRAQTQLWAWSARAPALRDAAISPVLLHTSASVEATHNMHIAGITLCMLALLYGFWHAIRRLLDYTRTKPIRLLHKSVRAPEGIAALISEVDGQLAARDPLASQSGLIFLPSWVLNVKRPGFSLMSAADVAWICPYTIKKKLYGVITTSTREEIHLFDRNGQTLTIATTTDKMLDMLKEIYYWAPWAVVGADPAMEARFGKKKGWFKKHPPKADLLKTIDDRRAQIMAAQADYVRQQATQAPQQPAPGATPAG